MTHFSFHACCLLLALAPSWIAPTTGLLASETAMGQRIGRRMMHSSDDSDDADAGISKIGLIMLQAQREAVSKSPDPPRHRIRPSKIHSFAESDQVIDSSEQETGLEDVSVSYSQQETVELVSHVAADVGAAGIETEDSQPVVTGPVWSLHGVSQESSPMDKPGPAEACPSGCNKRGQCTSMGRCFCAAAWSASDTCDQPIAPVLPCNLLPFSLPRWAVSMDSLNTDLATYGDDLCENIDVLSCKRQLLRYWARTLDLPDHDPVAPLLGGRCALVAGSQWLEACGDLGAEIDAHDVVLRVDDAPTSDRNYARVGARTTLRLTSGSAANFREGSELSLSLDEAFMPSAGGLNLLSYPEMVRALANSTAHRVPGGGGRISSAMRALHVALNLCGKLTLYGYSDHDDDGIVADAASTDALYYERWFSTTGFVQFAADAAGFKWDGFDREARWQPTIEGRQFTANMNDPDKLRAFKETVTRGLYPRPPTEEKEVGSLQRKVEARCMRQLKTLLPGRVSLRACEGSRR
eukprot:jgi/Mesvir1/15890/Mv02795-RA.1